MQLLALGIKDILNFDFMDQPPLEVRRQTVVLFIGFLCLNFFTIVHLPLRAFFSFLFFFLLSSVGLSDDYISSVPG